MENFWDTLSENLKDAYQGAEKHLKGDLVKLAGLPHILSFLKEMDAESLLLLLDQARKIKKRKNPKFPPINADFYDIQGLLTDDDRKILAKVREFMLAEVAPIANEYWGKAEFPFQIIGGLKKLNINGLTFDKSVGGQGRSNLLEGIIGEEIARTDNPSVLFGAFIADWR